MNPGAWQSFNSSGCQIFWIPHSVEGGSSKSWWDSRRQAIQRLPESQGYQALYLFIFEKRKQNTLIFFSKHILLFELSFLLVMRNFLFFHFTLVWLFFFEILEFPFLQNGNSEFCSVLLFRDTKNALISKWADYAQLPLNLIRGLTINLAMKKNRVFLFSLIRFSWNWDSKLFPFSFMFHHWL